MTAPPSLRPTAVAAAIESGRATAETCVAAAIQAVSERDGEIHAWVSVNANDALGRARRQDAEPITAGPLSGISIGIKDVIDIAGMPTRAGSRTRDDNPKAARDADIVAMLRAAGAIPLGKTATTEYATMDPCETRNPWNLSHTPGGSSSGSAAAVAAGMVSAAIGTQTAGSLCRPAAYCGIAGFKPTYGLLPCDGLVPLAPSFDTLGVMASRIEDCALILGKLLGYSDETPELRGRIGLPPEHIFADADPVAAAFLGDVAARLEKMGLTVEPVEAPFCFDAVVTDHRIVMADEAYHCHEAIYRQSANLLGPRFRELLEFGATLDDSTTAASRDRLATWREEFWRHAGSYDAILTLPAPGPAPSGLSTTGPAHYQIPWTVLQGPLATLPGSLARNGMPLACMLAAPPGRDRSLLALATLAGNSIYHLPPIEPKRTRREKAQVTA